MTQVGKGCFDFRFSRSSKVYNDNSSPKKQEQPSKVCNASPKEQKQPSNDGIRKIREEAAEKYKTLRTAAAEEAKAKAEKAEKAGPKAKAEEAKAKAEEAKAKAAEARRAAAEEAKAKAEEVIRAAEEAKAKAEEVIRKAEEAKARKLFLNNLTEKKGGNKSKKNSSVKKIKLTQKKK